MAITIQPAALADLEEILAIQKLAFQVEAALYCDNRIPPLLQTLDDLKTEWASRRFLKAVESPEGRTIGSVRAFEKEGVVHVEKLAVYPQFQRRGIGSQLLRAVEKSFPDTTCFELFTGHLSIDNIRLYERIGYRKVRERQINDHLTLIYLEKTVSV